MKNFSEIWILIFFCSLTFVACKKKETQQIPVGKVTQGTLFIDLYEEGEIEAIAEETIELSEYLSKSNFSKAPLNFANSIDVFKAVCCIFEIASIPFEEGHYL